MSTDFRNSSKLHIPQDKVEEYVNSLKFKAEKLIFNKFPQKILEFNKIVDVSNFTSKSLKDIHQEIPKPNLLSNFKNKPPPKRLKSNNNARLSKVAKIENENNNCIPINKHIVNLISAAKPRIKELIEDLNLLKMWISLMIPKIEDGNNFGVSVQAAVLAEIRSVETGTASFFDEISKYYVSRGKLISRVRKYPHVDDYRQAVEELDEKEYLSLLLMMIEIRNYYCSLHDVVTKNYDKIKKPRLTNACESLY